MIMHETAKMNLKELMEYWNESWVGKENLLKVNSNMESWCDAVRALIPNASAFELLEALHTLDTSGIVEEEILMQDALVARLTGDHEDRIKDLEKVVEILVQELGEERSKITIRKHIELKGVKYERGKNK